jgi:hypothetical protein
VMTCGDSADTGAGISPEQRKKIFEPLHHQVVRHRHRLATVKKLVERQGIDRGGERVGGGLRLRFGGGCTGKEEVKSRAAKSKVVKSEVRSQKPESRGLGGLPPASRLVCL